jgi:nucleoid-associated protein Lsr2
VTIDLIDDLDGTAALETVRFELDGSRYEIELSGSNADQLRNKLRPYINQARADRLFT